MRIEVKLWKTKSSEHFGVPKANLGRGGVRGKRRNKAVCTVASVACPKVNIRSVRGKRRTKTVYDSSMLLDSGSNADYLKVSVHLLLCHP